MARRPLDGAPYITQAWGELSNQYRKGYHTGVDYGVSNNTAVKSPTNGTIIQVGDGRAASDGRGFFIIIQGDDGVTHHLYHLARWHVGGGRVSEGQHIADTDNTGLSSGPHLHWETRRGGVDFNPAEWLFAPTPAPAPAPAPSQPVLAGNQRLLANKDGVYQREAPNTDARIIKDWAYDREPFTFKGFVHGQDPYGTGNDIWFVGAYSGGYFWSGAFEDKSVHDLADLTPNTPQPDPPAPSVPIPDIAVDFEPDYPGTIGVYASPDVDELKTQVPKFIVIHQWGAPEDNFTLQGVINGFTKDNGLNVHYIVNDDGVFQNVPENKRAQHAGPLGNDGIGIECDPNGGDEMYKHLRLLRANITARWGDLAITKHSDYMETECPKYIDIEKIKHLEQPVPADQTKVMEMLQQILDILTDLRDRFTRIFK